MGVGERHIKGMVARNEDELQVMRQLASSGRDHPVLMLNVNRYRVDSGFPDQPPYVDYMECLEDLVRSVGGRIEKRMLVLGQPVGRQPPAHEILAIWYPSNQAYLDLP